jgi:hypothetical protein
MTDAKKERRFVVKKRLDLEPMFGEDWKDCYLVFTPVNWKEAQALKNFSAAEAKKLSKGERENLANETIDMLKAHFVSGRGYDGEGIIEMVADDLELIPVEYIPEAAKLLRGNLDPKSLAA